MPSKDTQFKPGWKGGPGRPKSGRTQALAILDKLLSEAQNKKVLKDSLQSEFDKDPAKFFRTYGMPLLPKEVNLEMPEGVTINFNLSRENGKGGHQSDTE